MGTTYLKLVVTAGVWGGAFVAAKWAVGEAPPFTVAAARFAIATLVFFPLVAWQTWGKGGNGRFPIPRGIRQVLGLFTLGLTGIFLYNALFFTGLKYTTAVNGSLIVAINPMLTAMLSALWLKERIRPLQAAGFLVSFAGVVTVISKGSIDVIRHMSFNAGDLIMLGAPLAWAVYSIRGKRAMNDFSPLAATAYASLFGVLLLVPAAVLTAHGSPGVAAFTVYGWLAVLQLALLATVLGFVWWYEGVKTIGAGRSAMFVNLVPLFAIVLAAILLGERILWPQLLGGALVVGGVCLGTAAGRTVASYARPAATETAAPDPPPSRTS